MLATQDGSVFLTHTISLTTVNAALLSTQKPSMSCDPRSVEKSSLAFASHFAEIFVH